MDTVDRYFIHTPVRNKHYLSMLLSSLFLIILFANFFREFITNTHTGQSWKVPGLYSVNGEAVDYLYYQYSIPSFSVEVIQLRGLHSSYLQPTPNFEKSMVFGLRSPHYEVNAISSCLIHSNRLVVMCNWLVVS